MDRRETEKTPAIGAKQVMKAVSRDQAVLVYIAQDADERVTEPIRKACTAKNVPMEMGPNMKELGRAHGIAVGAAAVALLKK